MYFNNYKNIFIYLLSNIYFVKYLNTLTAKNKYSYREIQI